MTNFNDPNCWPAAFAWCRLGAESNQSVDTILKGKHKDAEQCNGQFWYGFRSTHMNLDTLGALIDIAGPNPIVALTNMRSKAHPRDSDHPGPQFQFTKATTLQGAPVDIPAGVRVRARQKERSLALVCRSLHWRPDPDIPANLPFTMNELVAVNGKKIAFQNTTAFVKQRADGVERGGTQYELLAVAQLVPPYVVRLGGAETITE